MTFRTPDEALSKANNSAYGLSAGVWTEKGSRAMAMAAGLRAGVVWDNTFNRFDATAAFGGYKESGFGREGGPAGMAAYLDTDDEVVLASPRADQHEGVLASPRADQHEGVLASPRADQHEGVLG
jgi:aldehyde dehydrogenase (NAD+)